MAWNARSDVAREAGLTVTMVDAIGRAWRKRLKQVPSDIVDRPVVRYAALVAVCTDLIGMHRSGIFGWEVSEHKVRLLSRWLGAQAPPLTADQQCATSSGRPEIWHMAPNVRPATARMSPGDHDLVNYLLRNIPMH